MRKAIISLGNKCFCLLKVAVLHRFYCIFKKNANCEIVRNLNCEV